MAVSVRSHTDMCVNVCPFIDGKTEAQGGKGPTCLRPLEELLIHLELEPSPPAPA